ncbi:MAG: hypothetical protein ACLP5H_06880 [Desulfomonilaceae bacterium]
MNGRSMIGKLSAMTATLLFLTVLQPLSVSALEPVFEIRAKDGHTVVGDPLQRLSDVLDAENSVRIGVELRPGLRAGIDSEHGLALVFEF